MSPTLAEYVDAPLEQLTTHRPLGWLHGAADRARDLSSAASLLRPPNSVPSVSSRTARHRWVPSQGLDACEGIGHELPHPLARRPRTSLGWVPSTQAGPGTLPQRPHTIEPGELPSCLDKAPVARSRPQSSRLYGHGSSSVASGRDSRRRTPALSPLLATSEATALGEAAGPTLLAAVLPKRSSSSNGAVLHRGFTSQLQSGVAGGMKPRALRCR